MDITTIKYGRLVGIGESSHGTREFQDVRLEIIQHLHSLSPIQVFIEANYIAIELLKVPGISRQDYIAKVKRSILFHHLKSDAFCKILWFLQSNHIPYFGVDMQINKAEPTFNPVVTWIRKYRGQNKDKNLNRSHGMHALIELLRDPSTRAIFLAHNYHVSKYTSFPGTKIGFATREGTVTQYDNSRRAFVKRKFDYSKPDPTITLAPGEKAGEQHLDADNPTIFKSSEKSFLVSGEAVWSDRQLMACDAFDYVIFIPHTTAL